MSGFSARSYNVGADFGFTAKQTFSAGLDSGVLASIADDGAGDFGDVSPNEVSLVFIWLSQNAVSPLVCAAFRVRTSASPVCAFAFGVNTLTDVSTSDVSGTTGTDGHFTISATNGHLKVENRSGGASSFVMLRLGAN